MPVKAKASKQDIGKVAIPAKAYDFLHEFIGSLKMRILETAACEAQTRDGGRGPGKVQCEDILRAMHARLPIAFAEIDRMLKVTKAHVRNAS